MLLFSATATALPSGYKFYPVPGISFPSTSASLIKSQFRKLLAGPELDSFRGRFLKAFAADAEDTITDANKRHTFAVSMQLVRASLFTVKKSNRADVYIPITASVYLTNVMTGEVLYTVTRTDYVETTDMLSDIQDRSVGLDKLFLDNFHTLTDELVADVRAHFKPEVIATKVAREWSGLAILDGGQDKGLARDDTLVDETGNNELRVISTGLNYAVAKSEQGKFKVGGGFFRISNKKVGDLQKPRILPIVDEAPEGFPRETLVQIFSDALGSKAPVSLVPINETYKHVQETIAQSIDMSQEQLSQRELPDMFLRLAILDPLTYEAPTKLAHKQVRVTDAVALAEVVDNSGRVLYAGHGRDQIEDEIVAGIVLPLGARREIAIKNAMLDLAKHFASDFKVSSATLNVTSGGTNITIADPAGVLSVGSSARVFRRVGKGKGEVLVPIWEVEVTDSNGNTAQASAALPEFKNAPNPDKGDVVIIEAAPGAPAVRNRFSACGSVEKLGAIEIPEFEALANNVLAAKYRAPYYLSGLAERISNLLHDDGSFKPERKQAPPKIEYCVQPVYRIDGGPQKCKDEYCSDTASVKLTYRIRKGTDASGEVRVRHAMETKMDGRGMMKDTSSDARRTALRVDLIDEILKLGSSAAADLANEKL